MTSAFAEDMIVRLDAGALDELPARERVGGKAWSIARLATRGLPVPAAFVISTAACARYHETGQLPDGLVGRIRSEIGWLSQQTGRIFGGEPPLLVSVRSGAPVSMPGMMDTILNLGLRPESVDALAATQGREFAYDTLRRFLETYVTTVLRSTLPDELPDDGSAESWFDYLDRRGLRVPRDPVEQLLAATRAVFDSWNSRRAKRYRASRGIPDTLGTAVTVQAMVFGNRDEWSGTGVLFSRDPRTGHREPYGQYLARAQGEDVVSGRADPMPLTSLRKVQPEVHRQLLDAAEALEREDRDVQDIEFTVDTGRLFILQTRVAARSPLAAVRFAVAMVEEGLITPREALARVTPEQSRLLLRPRLESDPGPRIAVGEPASGGVGVGRAVSDPEEAERLASEGQDVVLVRETTSPEDVHGMLAARAVVTAAGGGTSHAAVVGRALGIPCVVGCGAGVVDQLMGRDITVDGTAGTVHEGLAALVTPREDQEPEVKRLLEWAREASPVTVLLTHDLDEAADDLADLVDLDHLEGGTEADRVGELLAGAAIARGSVLESVEGMEAALRAGVQTFLAPHALPVHLAAIAAQEGIR